MTNRVPGIDTAALTAYLPSVLPEFDPAADHGLDALST
jgi:hypothetical protein